jgi:hypothetical protein
MTSPILKVENAYINLKYVTDVDGSGDLPRYCVNLVNGEDYRIPKDILPLAVFIDLWEAALK